MNRYEKLILYIKYLYYIHHIPKLGIIFFITKIINKYKIGVVNINHLKKKMNKKNVYIYIINTRCRIRRLYNISVVY